MKRVYLDANIVIYFVEQHPRFLPVLLQHMFDANGAEQVACVTSDLCRLETRVLRHCTAGVMSFGRLTTVLIVPHSKG